MDDRHLIFMLLLKLIQTVFFPALMMHKKQQYEFRIAMQKRSRRILGRKMEVIRTEKEMQDVRPNVYCIL